MNLLMNPAGSSRGSVVSALYAPLPKCLLVYKIRAQTQVNVITFESQPLSVVSVLLFPINFFMPFKE